jgi:hypothetical protein
VISNFQKIQTKEEDGSRGRESAQLAKQNKKRKDQVTYKAPDISSKSNLEPPENSAEKGDGSTTFCLGKKKENLIRFLLSSSKKMMGTRSRPLSKEDPS